MAIFLHFEFLVKFLKNLECIDTAKFELRNAERTLYTVFFLFSNLFLFNSFYLFFFCQHVLIQDYDSRKMKNALQAQVL